MDESHKKEIIENIEKDSSTLGVEIPESIVFRETEDNEEIPIRQILFNEDEYELEQSDLKIKLRREKNEIIDTIESSESMEYSKGKELAKKAKRIDRTIDFIKPSEDIEQKHKLKRAKGQKRWNNFIDKIKDISEN
jgi:hypothetical protein